MFDLVISHVLDTRFMAMVFAAIGAIATVLTLAMPLIATDTLGKRMKAVAIEREKMRQRERERLARGEKVSLRRSPKQYMQTVVDRPKLRYKSLISFSQQVSQGPRGNIKGNKRRVWLSD